MEKKSFNASENKREEKSKKCPYCAEEIKVEAVKCKHCNSDLSQSMDQGGVINKQKSSGVSTAETQEPLISSNQSPEARRIICQQCNSIPIIKKKNAMLLFWIGLVLLIFYGFGLILWVIALFMPKYWYCPRCKIYLAKYLT